MVDAYERRVFLTMIGYDEKASTTAQPLIFGPNGWSHFLRERRFLARCIPITCRCGHRCPGPFMEMHDCEPAASEKGSDRG